MSLSDIRVGSTVYFHHQIALIGKRKFANGKAKVSEITRKFIIAGDYKYLLEDGSLAKDQLHGGQLFSTYAEYLDFIRRNSALSKLKGKSVYAWQIAELDNPDLIAIVEILERNKII